VKTCDIALLFPGIDSERALSYLKRFGSVVVLAESDDRPEWQDRRLAQRRRNDAPRRTRDGELDTGTIAPGAFSQPMALVGPGPYHCSIHPEMVGRITDKP
jgi:hypothetical protein